MLNTYDVNDFRSGSAPTKSTNVSFNTSGLTTNLNVKPPSGSRGRPKTRSGAVTTTVSSSNNNNMYDLSDLNLHLKMEKCTVSDSQNNNYYQSSFVEEYVEMKNNVLSDVWNSANVKGKDDFQPNKKPESPYIAVDPVLAAYSSQFKPIRMDSNKVSTKPTSSSKTKAAEIRAIYGLKEKEPKPPSRKGSRGNNTTERESTSRASSAKTSTRKQSEGIDGLFSDIEISSNPNSPPNPENSKKNSSIRQQDNRPIIVNYNDVTPVEIPSGHVSDQRPQSRKLYLGSSPTTRSGGNIMRASHSAGNASKQLTQKNEGPEHQLGRISSFSGLVQPALWDTDTLNERPPSRQKTAFPFHLADHDDHGAKDKQDKQKKKAFAEPQPNAFPEKIPIQESVTSLNRPPSRQRIAAQNLWGDGGDSQYIDNEYNRDIASSPILTPYASSISIGLSNTIDRNDSDSPEYLSSTSIRRAATSVRKTESPTDDYRYSQTANPTFAPMYDPIADGFAMLDNKTSATFKIQLNNSTFSKDANKLGGEKKHFWENGDDEQLQPPSSRGRSQSRKVQLNDATRKRSSPYDNTSSQSSQSGLVDSTLNMTIGSPEFEIDSSKSTRSHSPTTILPKKNRNVITNNIQNPPVASEWMTRTGTGNDANPSAGNSNARGRGYSDVDAVASCPGVDDIEEDLTVMSLYSDDELESSNILLESSLGQDFLNLFAQAR